MIGVIVGAVLRPVVQDRLSRKADSDRHQRTMINAWLEMTRKKWAFHLATVQLIGKGKPVDTAATDSIGALNNWMQSEPDVTKYPWEPDRVRNTTLRTLFHQLSAEMAGLLNLTLEASKGAVSSPSYKEQVMDGIKRAEELRNEIVREMPAAGL